MNIETFNWINEPTISIQYFNLFKPDPRNIIKYKPQPPLLVHDISSWSGYQGQHNILLKYSWRDVRQRELKLRSIWSAST